MKYNFNYYVLFTFCIGFIADIILMILSLSNTSLKYLSPYYCVSDYMVERIEEIDNPKYIGEYTWIK